MRASISMLMAVVLGAGAARAVEPGTMLAVKPAEGPPRVTKVLVYPDAAVVTRAMDVSCGKDAVSAKFLNLPPAMDPDSVRASAAAEGARIEGVTVNERVRAKAYAAEVQEIDRQIEAAKERLSVLSMQIERARAARERAAGLWQMTIPFINREAAVLAKPNTTAWSVALDQGRTAQDEADALRRAAETEQREAKRTLSELERRRAVLDGAAPSKAYDAEVVLRCSGRTTVELSYLTTAARWSPSYEARADTGANAMELSVLADVTQWTGESWGDVSVTLSTAQSRRDAQPPKLQRLYVGQSPKEETKKVLVKRSEAASHLTNGLVGSDKNGGFEAADQGLSVQLTVPGKSDLEGDGRPARLVVQRLGLPAEFSLVSVPKVLPHVLARGQAKNAAKFPLLAGPVSLFSKGAFLGTTRLERVAEGDTVKLAFGLNESIQVKRSTLTEEKAEAGFLSSTRRLRYGYRIELTSTATKAQTVELQEHIPVSELEDVKVVVEKETTGGYSRVATDGLLTWPVTLGPGERKTVELHFTVEVPTKYDSAGL